MQLTFIFSLLFILSAQAQTLQQKIDRSVMDLYQSNAKPTVDVVSVERAYLMSNGGLKQYVEVKDDKFNAEISGQPLTENSAIIGIKNLWSTFLSLKNKGQEPVSSQKIENQKKDPRTSAMVGQKIKEFLASYKNAKPLKITNVTCSAEGVRLEAYYQQQKFTFTQKQVGESTAKTHATQIQFQNVSAIETEQFIQTGSYQLPVYETYKYQIKNDKKVTPVASSTLSSGLIDQFLKSVQLPMIKLDPKIDQKNAGQVDSKLTTKAGPAELKNELQATWSFLKRVGACCAESECRHAVTTVSSPQSRSSSNGGLSPYAPSSGGAGPSSTAQ